MGRIGKVVRLDNDIAIISLMMNDSCGECNSCSHGSNDSVHDIEAINNVGAVVGDKVEFDMEITSLLKAAFIAYTIPLITMVGSIALSIFFLKSNGYEKNVELYATIIGFTVLFLTLLSIRLFDKKIRDSKKFMPNIIKIVEKYNKEVFIDDYKKM